MLDVASMGKKRVLKNNEVLLTAHQKLIKLIIKSIILIQTNKFELEIVKIKIVRDKDLTRSYRPDGIKTSEKISSPL